MRRRLDRATGLAFINLEPDGRGRTVSSARAVHPATEEKEAAMLLSARDLESFTLGALDGDIGSVQDLFFDDRSWTVRYLVVDTGTWLPGRRVLISPMSVREVNWSEQRLAVNLTKAQIENSPDLETAHPITRQHELAFLAHYGLSPYWGGPYRWGAVPYPFAPGEAVSREADADLETARSLAREGWQNVGPPHLEARHLEEERDGDLRSGREVIGYAIQAVDGDLGHVEDFLVETETWAVRYMVVDTRNWWPGKKVLISPEWVGDVSWGDAKVAVAMTRQQIRKAPEYDPSRPLEREQELRLYEHYGRPKYWEWEERDRDSAA